MCTMEMYQCFKLMHGRMMRLDVGGKIVGMTISDFKNECDPSLLIIVFVWIKPLFYILYHKHLYDYYLTHVYLLF